MIGTFNGQIARICFFGSGTFLSMHGSVKYDVVAKKLTIAGISGYVFWWAINSVLQALGTQENRLVF